MKILFKSILAYIKKNFFAYACFFWAGMVFLTGSVSYSKYITTDKVDKLPGAGSFSCSANIDGVSSLSFINTAFWGGSIAEDKVAMSALRSIDFAVNNFETIGGEKVVNEVKTSYSLSFSAPYNFVKRLALQPFKFDEVGAEVPILPQVVIGDIFHAYEFGVNFHTSYSDDYEGIDYLHDMEFVLEKNGEDYIATSYDANGNVVTQIRLEYFERETHQKLMFRMWDVSDLTSEEQKYLTEESGKLLPPLEVYFRRKIPFYKIIISIPGELVLPAGVETTRKHSIHMTPTHTIHDDHLGGYFVNYHDGVYGRVNELYGQNIEDNWIIETVEEGHVGKFYHDEALTNPILDAYGDQVVHTHDFNIMDSPTVYNSGEDILGKPVSFTEVLEHTHGDWTYKDSTLEKIPLSNMTNIGIKKDSAGNWSLDNSTYPAYKVSISGAMKEVATSYSKMELGTLTREVTEVENIHVLGADDGYPNATGLKAYLRVAYEDKVTSYVTGPVTRTITTTHTFNMTLQKKSSNWWGTTTYNNVNANNEGLTKETVAQLLLGVDELEKTEVGTKDVTIDLGDTEETRYQLREVTRRITHAPVTIEYLRWPVMDSEGNSLTDADGNIIYRGFTQDDPLKLYGNDDIQDYYISPCYSKNYPFYVDVIFEQIQ